MLADAAAKAGRSTRDQADEFVKVLRPSSIIQRAAEADEVATWLFILLRHFHLQLRVPHYVLMAVLSIHSFNLLTHLLKYSEKTHG